MALRAFSTFSKPSENQPFCHRQRVQILRMCSSAPLHATPPYGKSITFAAKRSMPQNVCENVPKIIIVNGYYWERSTHQNVCENIPKTVLVNIFKIVLTNVLEIVIVNVLEFVLVNVQGPIMFAETFYGGRNVLKFVHVNVLPPKTFAK